MKHKLLVLLFAVCCLTCKSQSQKYNAEAIKLNNEAVSLTEPYNPNNRALTLKKAIELENQAIKIDSTYVVAYWSRLSFQGELKDYKAIAATGKQFSRFFPVYPDIKIEFGLACEKVGDTVAARKFFTEGLVLLNKTLDTMNVNNQWYTGVVQKKAADLVYLHQEQTAYKLIEKLNSKEVDIKLKHAYQKFIKTSREELVKNEGLIEARWDENGIDTGISIGF